MKRDQNPEEQERQRADAERRREDEERELDKRTRFEPAPVSPKDPNLMAIDLGDDDDENSCRTCGERYPDAGDGWDGECPDCADARGRDEGWE